MKKILTLCAALVAAMSMNAITSMTCSEAKNAALALQSGATGTDSVAVTGYVTYTNGTVSPSRTDASIMQQVFWMDDNKGTTQTFQAYWCNLPSNEALNVGDKVTIKGFLMNYGGSTAEMKNGDVVILERAVVHFDTLAVSVCEAITEGEALNDREITNDFFTLTAVVSAIDTEMDQYNVQSFFMTCADNNKQLQAYKLNMVGGVAAHLGDTVEVFGKIQKYGEKIEIISGNAKVIGKGNIQQRKISATVAQAVTEGMLLERGAKSVDLFIVEGYVDSIAFAFSEKNKNMSFYMCDDMQNPTYNFEAYRVSTDQDVAIGTKVYVMGMLYHYYKAATETAPEIDLVEISDGKLYLTDPSAINNFREEKNSVKVMENGQIYIIKDNVKYSVLGVEVK